MLKKIGVLSDSHENVDIVFKAVKKMGPVDLLLHAGDGVKDVITLSKKIGIKVECVKGNCDFMVDFPEEKVITFYDYRILLTHGNLYGIKHSLNKLYFRAKETKADIVVFGHTHVPLKIWWEDVLFFNPGSVSKPVGNNPGSCGVITVDNRGNITGEIIKMG